MCKTILWPFIINYSCVFCLFLGVFFISCLCDEFFWENSKYKANSFILPVMFTVRHHYAMSLDLWIPINFKIYSFILHSFDWMHMWRFQCSKRNIRNDAKDVYRSNEIYFSKMRKAFSSTERMLRIHIMLKRTIQRATTNLCWNANMKRVCVVAHKVNEFTRTFVKLT